MKANIVSVCFISFLRYNYTYISFRKTDYVGKGVVCFFYILYYICRAFTPCSSASSNLAPDTRRE